MSQSQTRRTFLQQTGLIYPAALMAQPLIANSAERDFSGTIHSLHEAQTREGQILLRIELSSTDPATLAQSEGSFSVTHGTIARVKNYFFEPTEDDCTPTTASWRSTAAQSSPDILLVWLEQATPQTELIFSIKGSEPPISFTLQQLVRDTVCTKNVGSFLFTANFLLDKEMRQIDLREIGANVPGDDFDFVIMADPQGGDPRDETNDSTTRLKIHNAYIEESIRRVNQLQTRPAFTLICGDIVDSQGQESNFKAMHGFFKTMQSPVLFELGNHETAYSVSFSPGYDMRPFTNYFTAQRMINGLDDLLLYAFDAGQWHFIVWPDPLRANFWETHPHYFDWLERDLENNKERPTVFFQHVPIQPIGINPLVDYMESVEVKRMLFDILTRHGNVKYHISGHVHVPVKSSLKIARTYKGMNLITLPAAGYRPRCFGEEDLDGGPTQGIAIMKIRGKDATLDFQRVTGEVCTYPATFPRFNPTDYPLWLNHVWELPAETQVVNGQFEDDLNGWARRFVYREDLNPSNRCEVRCDASVDFMPSLYLYGRKRGYDAPGQDRLPQSVNSVCQAVLLTPQTTPLLHLSYKVHEAETNTDLWNGAYVWLEGYQGSIQRLHLLYWIGKGYRGLGGRISRRFRTQAGHFDLTDTPDHWHRACINLKQDFLRVNTGKSWEQNSLNRLVIHLGVWTENEGAERGIGVSFRDISIKHGDVSNERRSVIDGEAIPFKDNKELFSKINNHTAGEHQMGETRRSWRS
jgi:hypothetical protein